MMGKRSQRWITKGERVLMPNYARFPLVFTKGDGAALISADNSSHLDFVSGIAVNSLGHCDKSLILSLIHI